MAAHPVRELREARVFRARGAAPRGTPTTPEERERRLVELRRMRARGLLDPITGELLEADIRYGFDTRVFIGERGRAMAHVDGQTLPLEQVNEWAQRIAQKA